MKRIVCIAFTLSFIIPCSSLCQTWQTYDSLRAVYLDRLSFDTSLVYAEKALQSVKEQRGENDTLYANMLRLLVGVEYYSGKYPDAIRNSKREVEIRKQIQGENSIDYALTLNDLANLYGAIGEYSAAVPLFLEERNILKKNPGEKDPFYARCLNDLGQTYWQMGDYSHAEPLLIESKNIRKEVLGEKDPDYAVSLNNLAVLYQDMGNYPESEALLIEARDIIRDVFGEKHTDYAMALNNLAVLYWMMKRFSDAEPLYIEAGNIDREVLGEDHPDYAFCINNLAKLYQAMGNYKAAEPLLKKALDLRKITLGEKHPDYATSLNNLAGLYDEMGRYQAAEPLMTESMKIRKEVLGEKHPDYATSLNNLARLYEEMNNFTSARSYYTESLEKMNNSVIQNFAFLSEKEKELYFKTLSPNFENFYSFSLREKSNDPSISGIVFNNVVRNKGLLLKSSTAMRTAVLNSNDTSLISKYEKWIGIKKELSKLYSGEISKREADPAILEEQANSIEKELVRASVLFSDFQDLQKITWESVRKSLKRGEAAIEFTHFAESKKNDSIVYCALIIRSEYSNPEMIRLFNENDLDSLLGSNKSNNSEYINKLYGSNRQTNAELYRLIWLPLEKYLKGIRTVYYSPDGQLHKVSFSAVGTGNNKYLCDKFRLFRLSTTGRLTGDDSYNISKNMTAGIYGGIDYSSDSTDQKVWNYLPGTKIETDKIVQILRAENLNINYFSGRSATEGSFKELFSYSSSGKKPEILHIATHGFFYPDPELLNGEKEKNVKTDSTTLAFRGGNGSFGLWQFVKNKNPLMRSGLVLSGANNVWNRRFADDNEDGVLTAQEVTQLDLQKTRLVVLSACETGLGDIKGSEGVYGLQRAFKMAGAKYMIISLWQVPDAATSEFMVRFYDRLLITRNVQVSFNETQGEMRKKYDPYYWAAFVLTE